MNNHISHQMQLTSLYNYFPSYSEEQFNQAFREETKRKIIRLLQVEQNMTDREMAKALNYEDPNKVRPRRNELVKLGIIEEEYKRTCAVGNKLSIAWRLSKDTLLAYINKG